MNTKIITMFLCASVVTGAYSAEKDTKIEEALAFAEILKEDPLDFLVASSEDYESFESKIKELTENKVFPVYEVPDYSYPLFWDSGTKKKLEFFLKNGHSIDQENEQGMTILHYLAISYKDMCFSELDGDYYFNGEDSDPYFLAEHVKKTSTALECGATVNKEDKSGMTALAIVAEACFKAWKSDEMRQATFVGSQNNEYWYNPGMPCHYMELLIKNRAFLTPQQATQFFVPLVLNGDFVDQLLVWGADVSVENKDKNGDTILHRLIRCHSNKAVRKLLEKFPKVEISKRECCHY